MASTMPGKPAPVPTSITRRGLLRPSLPPSALAITPWTWDPPGAPAVAAARCLVLLPLTAGPPSARLPLALLLLLLLPLLVEGRWESRTGSSTRLSMMWRS